MKEKVNDLVRLHEGMQEKLKTASYSEQIQIFTLVPDKWSRMYCSENFNVFEYLVWISHEIKKVSGILAKPAHKKRKKYQHWNTSSDNKCLWRWQFQWKVPEKRDYVSVSKGVHKQKLCSWQKSL